MSLESGVLGVFEVFWCFWSAGSQKRFSSSISRFTGCQYGPETLSECTFYRPRACTFFENPLFREKHLECLAFFSLEISKLILASRFLKKSEISKFQKINFWNFQSLAGAKKCIFVGSEYHISSHPNMKDNCWTILEKNDFEKCDFQKKNVYFQLKNRFFQVTFSKFQKCDFEISTSSQAIKSAFL